MAPAAAPAMAPASHAYTASEILDLSGPESASQHKKGSLHQVIIYLKQECIPVGCVPCAAVTAGDGGCLPGGGSLPRGEGWGVIPMGCACPGVCLPRERCVCPGVVSAWGWCLPREGVCPGGVCPEGVCVSQHALRRHPPWTE